MHIFLPFSVEPGGPHGCGRRAACGPRAAGCPGLVYGTEGEVEAAVTAGKCPEMDDITSEPVSSVMEGTVKALTALCQKIWQQKKRSTEWTKSLVIPLPKTGSLRQCQHCRNISLTSLPSKVLQVSGRTKYS